MIASYRVKEVVYRDVYTRTKEDSEAIAAKFDLKLIRIPYPQYFPVTTGHEPGPHSTE
jgi:hypothetical protein